MMGYMFNNPFCVLLFFQESLSAMQPEFACNLIRLVPVQLFGSLATQELSLQVSELVGREGVAV